MKQRTKLTKTVFAALFAAVITVSGIVFVVPLPGSGYFHFADSFSLLAGSFLGVPLGVVASVCGNILLDLFSGFSFYIPSTVIVKSLSVLLCAFFCKISRKKSGAGQWLTLIFGSLLSELIIVGGYFLYEWLLLGFSVAILNVLANVLQCVLSVAAFVLFDTLLRKTKICRYFNM